MEISLVPETDELVFILEMVYYGDFLVINVLGGILGHSCFSYIKFDLHY